ncbi:MAG: hypothetical protein KKE91_01015, partial [Candidatus Omnitrophica bacterium]|nr:hypothetical protein [Candidatus Omnitrophota bacterium]
MRRNSRQLKVFLFAICYLLFAILGGCVKREITNIDSKGKNIICFGDSITWGYGVSPGQDYPSALAKMLNIPVINAGIDGDTSIEAVKRINTDIVDRDPLLVIIEFGGNDFLRKIPLEVTVNNIRNMVDEIQAEGAMVAIADVSTGFVMDEYRRAFYKISKETK